MPVLRPAKSPGPRRSRPRRRLLRVIRANWPVEPKSCCVLNVTIAVPVSLVAVPTIRDRRSRKAGSLNAWRASPRVSSLSRCCRSDSGAFASV